MTRFFGFFGVDPQPFRGRTQSLWAMVFGVDRVQQSALVADRLALVADRLLVGLLVAAPQLRTAHLYSPRTASPATRAGRGRRGPCSARLARELLHLPDEPGRAGRGRDSESSGCRAKTTSERRGDPAARLSPFVLLVLLVPKLCLGTHSWKLRFAMGVAHTALMDRRR
jgi:hypothetical protein